MAPRVPTPLETLFRGRQVRWAFMRAIKAAILKAFIEGYMLRADPPDAIAEVYARKEGQDYLLKGCIPMPRGPEIPRVTRDEINSIRKMRHIVAEIRLGHMSVEVGCGKILDLLEEKEKHDHDA